MNKIKVLGSANLPLDEREEVSFTSVIPKSQTWGHMSNFFFFFPSITQFLAKWSAFIPQLRCIYSQT